MIEFRVTHPLTGDAVVSFARYRNDRIALQLQGAPGSAFAGEAIGTVSVNLPGLNIAQDEVAIKTYSEHEGILTPLVAAGVIEPHATGIAHSGFATVPIHRLTPAALEQARMPAAAGPEHRPLSLRPRFRFARD